MKNFTLTVPNITGGVRLKSKNKRSKTSLSMDQSLYQESKRREITDDDVGYSDPFRKQKEHKNYRSPRKFPDPVKGERY